MRPALNGWQSLVDASRESLAASWNCERVVAVCHLFSTALRVISLSQSYDASTFETIARLIASCETDVGWLALGLRDWVWPQEGAVPRFPRADRARFFRNHRRRPLVAETLFASSAQKTLPDASKRVSELANDFAISSYLTDKQFGKESMFFRSLRLHSLLHELTRRCGAVRLSPDLVSASGKAKSGRNNSLAPDQVDEKVACASAIGIAWEFARGEPPGSYVPDAGKAAELLLAMGMAPPGQFDLVVPRTSWSGRPAYAWPPYFEKAREPSPMLLKWRRMLEQRLRFRADHTDPLSPMKSP